uniref:Rho-GAP domain-containing protein n=1 Tax=Populus trichocarpa TaxID=3694 RepID=A0A2K2BMB2_POPTR
MSLNYDSKGNCIPTILLMMQDRLYSQGDLKAEGVFRLNPENSQERHARDQLNKGIVPDDTSVHCLAGLIKAWFRELPSGVLDGLSPVQLVKQLKPPEAALLNWAVGLMADVVEEEDSNKKTAGNIAMDYAPNMTQMSDPFTALMHAHEETATGGYSPMSSHSSGQQTDEEFDSQLEMDYDDRAHYRPGSEEEDNDNDVESLSEVEECILRQLDGDKNCTAWLWSNQLAAYQKTSQVLQVFLRVSEITVGQRLTL